MRRKHQEITDKSVLDKILSTSEVCHIAMIDGDRPYLLPFNYGYKDNCIYVHAAPEGKKIDVLQKNNEVCFEITHTAQLVKKDEPCKWTSFYRSVVGYGTIEIITDYEEKVKGMDIIMGQYGSSENNVYNQKNIDYMVILKLAISELTGKQSCLY